MPFRHGAYAIAIFRLVDAIISMPLITLCYAADAIATPLRHFAIIFRHATLRLLLIHI